MSGALLIIVTLIYLGVAVDKFISGSPDWCLVFGAYALANVGLIWAQVRGMT